MSPSLTRCNTPNGARSDAKHFTDDSSAQLGSLAKMANLYDNLSRNFCSTIKFALQALGWISSHPVVKPSGPKSARLSLAVCHIISVGAEKQMKGINTGRVVARMANTQFFGINTVIERIHETVSFKRAAVDGQISMAFRATSASPFPTTGRRDDNLSPKAKGLFHAQLNRGWMPLGHTSILLQTGGLG